MLGNRQKEKTKGHENPVLYFVLTNDHVCYEYLFEKSRGIAGSSFLAFLKFSLIHICFPLWYKTEIPGHVLKCN